MRMSCSEEPGVCGHWQPRQGQHCCAGSARGGQPCAQAEVQGSLPSLLPPWTRKVSPGLRSSRMFERRRLCIWQSCCILVSGEKSTFTPHRHWLLEGCSHQMLEARESSASPFCPACKCYVWNSRDIHWQNIPECKGDVWGPIRDSNSSSC